MAQEQTNRFHLNIIDNTVELPEELCGEYSTIDEAYSALEMFIRKFDGVKVVDGRICDADDEDVDYVSSVV